MSTSEEQLRSQVQMIADQISGHDTTWHEEWFEKHSDEYEVDATPDALDYLEDALDIEYVVSRRSDSSELDYKGARILVAFGGPNIWIDTRRNSVDGYWWGDQFSATFNDALGLDDALSELWACR